jgi:hypothetical protein
MDHRNEQVSTPAPTHADDVATLREAIQWAPDCYRNEYRARLDRIAARAPQRATDTRGVPLWLHQCGESFSSESRPGHVCAYCDDNPEAESWRALYVRQDGA